MPFTAGSVLTASQLNTYATMDTVTSLPVSPTDGQHIYYVADSTNGVVWHLRYRSASASAYKWEYVGGPELQTVDLNTRTVLSAAVSTFVTYTGAPSITAPLAGDYAVVFGAMLLNGSNGNACNARIGLSVAAGAVTYYGSHELNTNVVNNGISVEVSANVTGVTAAQVIDVRGGSNGLNHTFRNSFLRVRPVRVG